MTNHPVFEKFSPYSGKVPEGCQTDYMGTRTRCEFVADTAPSPSEVQMGCPPVDEEYFEWIDILESVARARDRYTMLELGSGYGRWAVRAASAVRQRGIRECRLVAVEAEPAHFTWLKQHFCDNGLDPAQHTLVHGARKRSSGQDSFLFPDAGETRPGGPVVWPVHHKVQGKTPDPSTRILRRLAGDRAQERVEIN